MTEFTEAETKELIKIINEIDKTVKETRPKCTEQWQIDLLDQIEKTLLKKKE